MFTPLLTQVRPYYFSVDCGMSYIMRLCDGRFIIIDGNVGEYDEAEHLYSLLCEQNGLEGEPQIAAWFITHPHSDHFGCFVKFFRRFGDRVKIEKLYYHFPTPGIFDSEGSDRTEFNKVINEIDAEIIAPKTGDRYVFADAEFEVLFCCEDLYPGPVNNINNSSLVMKMHFGNYDVLWLGDLQREGSDRLCAQIDKEKLKCDLLQVGHHGYNGGSDELYRAADPKYLLWPCPDFWYFCVSRWECNDFILNSDTIKERFIAGRGEVTLDMTVPMPEFDPYDKTSLTADFSKKSPLALGWSCITGGRTGYAPAKLEFTDNGCKLTAEGDALTLCQMIQRGQVAKADRYSFEFSGEFCGGELFGIMFDSAKPTVWEESTHVELKPEKATFAYRLFVDRKAKKAILFNGEQAVAECALCVEPCDVILVLKNAVVKLDRVVYKELD